MIIRPFNSVFFMLMALVAAGTVALSFGFRKKSEKARTILMVSLCAATVVIFFIYKGFLSVDEEFLVASGIDKFNWWDELPLQLCNINMFLIAIGALTKNKYLLGFSFYTAPLGAFMALATPEPTFIGYPLFMPRILGFYVTHMMIVMLGILIVTLGFYKPSFKSLPGIIAVFLMVAACIHVVNFILRKTVCPFADYFFTFNPKGVSILELFWKWIPCPFLYLLPGLGILAVYMVIICTGFWIGRNLRAKKKEK